MKYRYRLRYLLVIVVTLFIQTAFAGHEKNIPLSYRSDVDAFITQLVKRDGFDKKELTTLFNNTRMNPEIIEKMTTPHEALPWHAYRRLFMTEKRIDGGVRFWQQHRKTLERAQQHYGVPPEIVIAIIGVETLYGERQGEYRIMDTLTTLGFDYPPREKFFRSELREYLLLCRERKIDPLSLHGSYAGAMGQPQFMPSSYRNFAVDFSGKGRPDLIHSEDDVIGSVANYFKVHGWRPNRSIAIGAQVKGSRYIHLLPRGREKTLLFKPRWPVKTLEKYGVYPEQDLNDGELVSLVKLDEEDGLRFWLGLQNFYVITRYNKSPLYAMAVMQLSKKIKSAHALAEQEPPLQQAQLEDEEQSLADELDDDA